MAILVIAAAYIGVMIHLVISGAPDIYYAFATATMMLSVAIAAMTGFTGTGRS